MKLSICFSRNKSSVVLPSSVSLFPSSYFSCLLYLSNWLSSIVTELFIWTYLIWKRLLLFSIILILKLSGKYLESIIALNSDLRDGLEFDCNLEALLDWGVRFLIDFNECIRFFFCNSYMSHFSYACKTEGKNGISRLISALCVNCLSSILEYSRIIDYSIIWMCIWCGLLQKLHKIKKSELLNSKVSFKL